MDDYRTQYERANRWGEPAFTERPYIGSPGGPAQDETNASNMWAHLNGGFLVANEYTRWWKESRALRNSAIVGDWSWLNKVRVTGPDATRFLNYATVTDIADQRVGQARFTPMTNEDGHVAIEGITFKLGAEEYMFTQSGALQWLTHVHEKGDWDVELADVTPEYTDFALQGPQALPILEALTGEDFGDLAFSRWRHTEILGEETIVARQGVTGEIGYEFFFPVGSGKAPDLWRAIREAGAEYGLRELGFRAQMIGHTEINLATAIRDYIPARMPAEQVPTFVQHWLPAEEAAALEWAPDEQFCTPGELGWDGIVDLDADDFNGRDALREEAAGGGPADAFVALEWDSDDVLGLFGEQFEDGDIAPPPQLPYGQFRVSYLPVERDGDRVGWASGVTYSPNLRRMIANARVPRALAASGTEVAVVWGGFTPEDPQRRVRATVEPDPLVESRERDDPRPV